MKRAVGRTGIEVHAIGLGGMPLSIQGRPDEAQGIGVITAALNSGVELIDTADVYCLDDHDIGHNERLIAKALKQNTGKNALIATKGGLIRPNGAWISKADPQHLRQACERSLKNLQRESIFLYQLHAPDDKVPFAESVGALKRLQEEGKIQHIGLSNVSVAQLNEAEKIVRIETVQNRCSLFFKRDFQNGLVETCLMRGITFIPHSPVGGWGGHRRLTKTGVVNHIADQYDVSPYRLALAWLLHKGRHILPIPGASKPASITDSAQSVCLQLKPEDIEALDEIESE